ncbi:DNA helicase [Tanacetum coccineum]
MDPAGRRSSQLMARSQRAKQNRRKRVDVKSVECTCFAPTGWFVERSGGTPLDPSGAQWPFSVALVARTGRHVVSVTPSPTTVEKFLSNVGVELPDPTIDIKGYNVISEFMIHGPCCAVNINASCMKDGGACNRNFPKPYCNKTYIDKDGFVHYCRRDTDIEIQRQNVWLDNRYVVPYNRTLWTERVIANVTRPEADAPSINPMDLWQKLWQHMSDDVPRKLSKSLWLPQIEKNEKNLKASILLDLETMLNSYSKMLKDFGLPAPPEDVLPMLQNRLLMEETNYNPDVLLKERDFLIPKLNEGQKVIFDEIIQAVDTNVQKLIFVYGHGGTGKEIPLESHHKRFMIGRKNCVGCCIFSQLADLLRHTNLIIWDEAPMNDRCCFEALDRCLRDILDNPNILFGGKNIMLGDDFRQTLPVKKKASKPEIVDASITTSYLWPKFKTYILKENIRLHQVGIIEAEKMCIKDFSTWLLDIGNGTIGELDVTDSTDTFKVELLIDLCIQDSDTAIIELINFIYTPSTFETSNATDLQKKAIVCLKNESKEMINTRVLTLLNTQQRVYLNLDEATPYSNDGGETELLYPIEYLNTLSFAGLPPHRLELKVGASIILLRNLNIPGGLYNGTRLIVTQLLKKVIEARIITGTRISEKVFLLCIPLINRDLQLPFVFKRKQVSIKLCYAMTINKIQGQSLERIGIFLPDFVFAHGQLYVALSRATSREGLKILNTHETNETGNMTKNVVYRDFLATIATVQGNAIQANMDLKYTDYFGQLLQLNSAYRILHSKRHAFWSLNDDILKITVLKTNTPYPSRRYGVSVPAFTKQPQRNKDQYAVKMDDPNITMEEYIRLEEEKARRRGKVYNWETATYGKIWDNEDVHDLGSVETEFPAIVFNDTLTSEAALSCEPTVSSLNNDEIDFRISFDESDDEDCTVIFDKNSFSYKIISVNNLKTDLENDNDKVNMPSLPSPEPSVSCLNDLDFFKDFKNKFPAIVYNDAQTSKSDLLTEPILNPQHIDEFNLKDETSLSECDEEEQNVLNFNDLFPFNVIYPDELKMDTDNDNDKVDIEHSSGDLSVKYLPDVSIRRILGYGYGVSTSCTVLEKSIDVGGEFTKSEDLKVLES